MAFWLMLEHGLDPGSKKGWSLGFNASRKSCGRCIEARMRIELSTYYVEHNSLELVRDTILHEIAHALVGANHGHDEVWKAKCLEIGAVPNPCKDASMGVGNWRADCPEW